MVETTKPAVQKPVKPKKSAAKSCDLPSAAIIRIAKKCGAERVGRDAVSAIQKSTEAYLSKLVKAAVALATHAGRKTIGKEDIELAAKQ